MESKLLKISVKTCTRLTVGLNDSTVFINTISFAQSNGYKVTVMYMFLVTFFAFFFFNLNLFLFIYFFLTSPMSSPVSCWCQGLSDSYCPHKVPAGHN